MELILILWSGYRVSKIDTSWFWFFRYLYKINLFLISSLNIWFFEIDFHVFFFTFLYVELSQFYSHGYGIHRLTWVNYDFFFLYFSWFHHSIFFFTENHCYFGFAFCAVGLCPMIIFMIYKGSHWLTLIFFRLFFKIIFFNFIH
jgi:hypothetical protein